MADQAQLDECLGGLEALGGSSGNGRLRDLLGWDEASSDGVKASRLQFALPADRGYPHWLLWL